MLSESLHVIGRRSRVLSEAYRLRLVGRLWFANLIFMVLPATFATAAAVFAAGNNNSLGAWLAGAAAVLTAVHKTLKCDEYQAECLRLNQGYKRIATLAESVLEQEDHSDPDLPSPQELIKEFAELEKSAKALLPESCIRKAEESVRKQHERDRQLALDLESPQLQRDAVAQ